MKAPIVSELDAVFITQREAGRVHAYRTWLASLATDDHMQAIEDYRNLVSPYLSREGKKINTFAPFRPTISAWQTSTKLQMLCLVSLCICWLLALLMSGWYTLTVTIAAITCLNAFVLLMSFVLLCKKSSALEQGSIDDALVEALKDADWPTYTILCPLYKESAVVKQLAKSLGALDYPCDKLQILLLVEEDDQETQRAILALDLPSQFQLLIVPKGEPRTKPRACNYGLMHAQGRYIVIYDAEDIPEPLQLKKALLMFANHHSDVACVQAKLNSYNP